MTPQLLAPPVAEHTKLERALKRSDCQREFVDHGLDVAEHTKLERALKLLLGAGLIKAIILVAEHTKLERALKPSASR